MSKLKEIRKFMGLTQKDLAEKAGVSTRHLQRIENSETFLGNAGLENIKNIEKVIGVTFEEMETINLNIFTKETREAVRSGDMDLKDILSISKLEQVKKLSKIGDFIDTFRFNYSRIPDAIIQKLSAEDIAALVDAFYQCYSDGKTSR